MNPNNMQIAPGDIRMENPSALVEDQKMLAVEDEEVMEVMAGHIMSPRDPDNPQNWPTHRKLYASAGAFAFAFVV